MKVSVSLGGGLALEVGDEADGADGYPTARLQKGLLLVDAGESLAEEGVGFGVPILKRGVHTVFPGYVDVTCRRDGSTWEVAATYRMDLVERLARSRGPNEPEAAGAHGRLMQCRALNAAKDSLAALHRRVPRLRGPLTTISAALRRAFGWVTRYEETASCGAITVRHAVHPVDGGAAEARVSVTVDLSGLTAGAITEVVVMNEQGAHHFDRYEDAGGADLCGADIGTWQEVGAARASFVSTGHRVSFSLGQAPGARLYRGRELVGSRLAWTGFGYSLPPARRSFGYELTIARTP